MVSKILIIFHVTSVTSMFPLWHSANKGSPTSYLLRAPYSITLFWFSKHQDSAFSLPMDWMGFPATNVSSVKWLSEHLTSSELVACRSLYLPSAKAKEYWDTGIPTASCSLLNETNQDLQRLPRNVWYVRTDLFLSSNQEFQELYMTFRDKDETRSFLYWIDIPTPAFWDQTSLRTNDDLQFVIMTPNPVS